MFCLQLVGKKLMDLMNTRRNLPGNMVLMAISLMLGINNNMGLAMSGTRLLVPKGVS